MKFRRKYTRFKPPPPDLSYKHDDLSATATPRWWELVYRWLFKLEYCDDDGKIVFAWLRVRRGIYWILSVLLFWFFIESLTAWNIFD